MKFTVSIQPLKYIVAKLTEFADKCGELPHLTVQTYGDRLTLSCCCGECEMQGVIRGKDYAPKIADDCICDIRGTALAGFLSHLPDPGALNVECDGKLVTFNYQDEASLTLMIEEVPYEPVRHKKEIATIRLFSAKLGAALDYVLGYIDSNSPRSSLHNAVFEVKGDELQVIGVSTDRMIRYESRLSERCPRELSLLLPREFLQGIFRLLTFAEVEHTLSVGPETIRFEDGPFTVTARLTIASYPDKARLEDRGFNKKIRVDRKELFTALRTVGVLSRPGTENSNMCAMEIYENTLEMVNKSLPPNQALARVHIPTNQGPDPFSFIFNCEDLTRALRNLRDLNVDLGFSEEQEDLLVIRGVPEGSITQFLKIIKSEGSPA